MTRIKNPIFLVIIILAASAEALSQGAHYTYPFSIGCPEERVRAGAVVSIDAKFEGGYTGENYSPTYNWSVSQGSIVSGQGTPSVQVDTGPGGGDVTVILNREFTQAHYPEVQREASCSIAVAPLPVARMYDEFRTAGSNCEEGFARLDSFFTELANNPVEDGLIVIYGDALDKKAAPRREKQLLNYFTLRKFDQSRVKVIRGAARSQGTTQFWLIPPGAGPPVVTEESGATVTVKQASDFEPYLYATDSVDGVPGCFGNLYDLAEYAGVLQSDPKSTARIVISESSPAKYRRKAREIVGELAEHGILRKRIVTVYKYVRANRLLEVAELWIVPAKRIASVKVNDEIGWARRCPNTIQSRLRSC